MTGPASKPNPASKAPVFVPHPDDVDDVREAFAALDRGEVLSADESAAYLRALEGEPSDT